MSLKEQEKHNPILFTHKETRGESPQGEIKIRNSSKKSSPGIVYKLLPTPPALATLAGL